MTTVYPLYDTYGNYLDGYYTRDYNGLIEYLLKTHEPKGYKVNLGIVDGVTVINNLHGDYSGYNCAIIEREDGTRDLYKITDKHFVRKDIWNITFVLDVFSKYYNGVITSNVLVNRLGIDRTTFSPLLFIEEDFTLTQKKVGQTNIVPVSEVDGTHLGHLYGYLMIWNNNEYSGFTYEISSGSSPYNYNYLQDRSTFMKDTYYDTKWVGFEGPFFILTYTNRIENYHFAYNFFSGVGLHIDETNSLSYEGGYYTIWVYSGGKGNENRYTSVAPQPSFYEKEFDTHNLNNNRGTTLDNMIEEAFNGYTIKPWKSTDVRSNQESSELNTMLLATFENRLTNFLTTIYAPDATREPNIISNYDQKILKDPTDDTYWRISVKQNSTNNTTRKLTDEDLEQLRASLQISDTLYNFQNSTTYGPTLVIKCPTYSVSLTKIGEDTPAVDVSIVAMDNTIDQPYTVVFIPIGLDKIKDSSGSITANDTMALDFIDYCIKKYSGDSAKLLDVQLCSMDIFNLNKNIGSDNILDLTRSNESITKYQIVSSENQGFALLRVDACDGINYNYSITKEVTDYKLEQQNRYVLRSPSGANSYEFSIAKNMGLNGFKMKWNIRPYGSMYQVQPIFNDNGLYGSNYTDDRGLVSLEDTSLTMYSSAWETYKRQNVNYANSFNEGQSFERSQLALTQKQQWQEFGVQAAGSAVSGLVDAAGDVASLGVTGKAYGIGVGGEQGGTAAADILGAGADIGFGAWQLSQQQKHQRQQLNMSQKHDRQQWNYSLGNIKALPNNMNKISGIYNTNTRFFYLEEYNPTEIETTAYQTYLDLFGIKIGYSLLLNQYTFDYIEGNIIKFNNTITNEEYEELQTELQSGRRLYTWEEEE